ncbi:MAG: lysophospholipid acyltransferase family protein [Paracoccaceae bacterium]
MSSTWQSADEPEAVAITVAGWLRVIWRGTALVLVTFGGLGILLLLRLVERPLCGQHRPWTPYITQFVCRSALVILGIRHNMRGEMVNDAGAVVANHSTWLDIFALHAGNRVFFVAKSEVASWPAIGWLARAAGTVFVRRNARDAELQRDIIVSRLKFGQRLLFFPEGTSTDGFQVLAFKSTLFAAFFTPEIDTTLSIQPVTVSYRAPFGEDARFYGWWGQMNFASHLLKTLAARHHGAVDIVYHAPLRMADFADRKALAKACEIVVRSGLPQGQS